METQVCDECGYEWHERDLTLPACPECGSSSVSEIEQAEDPEPDPWDDDDKD